MRMTRMNKEQQMVLEFHKKFGCTIGEAPNTLSESEQDLRLSLIEEELEELTEALIEGDLIGTADGLGDLLYVIYGCAIACGIDLEPVFAEIHRSNMTKTGGGER